MTSGQNWREIYVDGSAEAERLAFAELARDILDIQLKNQKKGHASEILRTFHAKIVLGVLDARLHVLDSVPARYRVGYFRPGATYTATVRLSNAHGTKRSDYQRDMRRAAIRVKVADNEYHDLLMTNFPVSHARDARQFVTFAKATAGAKLLILPRLILDAGLFETIRMLRNVMQATRHRAASLALE